MTRVRWWLDWWLMAVWPLTPDVAYWAIWPLPGQVWTLFTVINELMLISRLEMTRHTVGGCLSRLSRDHLILISDRGSRISSSHAAGGPSQHSVSGIRPSPAPGTCPALAPVSLHSLTADSCLGNVSSPLRLKYQFRKPISWHYHSPDVLLLHCYSAPSTCYSVQFGIILCYFVFQQGLVFHADSHEH